MSCIFMALCSAFGLGGKSSAHLYSEMIAPLVTDLFDGINGTVLAYGERSNARTVTIQQNRRVALFHKLC